MTRAQMIFDNNSDEFECFLCELDIDDLATILSSVSCPKCICKSFCDNHKETMCCQDTIKLWLKEDTE